jgi:hypothetical protein
MRKEGLDGGVVKKPLELLILYQAKRRNIPEGSHL